MTEVLKIKSRGLSEKIQKFLKEGKVLVFPTDTVYGILSDATNKSAVKKILKIKKRKRDKAIPVFIFDLKLAKKIAEISSREEKFLKKIWPGKVTVVLKGSKNCNLPQILFSKEKTIGLRIPKYSLLNKILERTKLPLTGTSANISGFSASTNLKEVLSQFKGKRFQPDVVVDAGNLKPSKPSTVIDISKKKFFLIREGQVPKEKLKKIYLNL